MKALSLLLLPLLAAPLGARGEEAPAVRRHPAAGKPFAHLNGGCHFVNELLSLATGQSPDWQDDGKVKFPKNARVVSEIRDAREQKLTVLGKGLSTSPRGEKSRRAEISLRFGEEGRLERIRLEEGKGRQRRAQEIEYSWPEGRCGLDRVLVEGPELGAVKGVSYDASLCKALQAKGLLDPGKIASCMDRNEQLGKEIEAAVGKFTTGESFVLFTTDPSGQARLQPWQRQSHQAVNEALARDCLYYASGAKSEKQPGPAELPPGGPKDSADTAR